MTGKYPLYLSGEKKGLLMVRMDRQRMVFEAECPEQGGGIYRARAIGDGGSLPLGVMCPENGRFLAKRSFDKSDLERSGISGITHGQAELSYRFSETEGGEKTPPFGWRSEKNPGGRFREALLSVAASDIKGAIVRPDGQGIALALPFEHGEKFPLMPLFCLASIEKIGGNRYAVFRIDGNGLPCF